MILRGIQTPAVLLCAAFLFGLSCGPSAATVEQERQSAYSAIFGTRQLDPFEGIWTTADRATEVAIIRADSPDSHYTATVLDSESSRYAPGDLFLHIEPGNRENSYYAQYYASPDSTFRTLLNFSGGHAALLWLPQEFSGDDTELPLFKVYPEKPVRVRPDGSKAAATGTGFFITRSIVATSNHIVAAVRQVRVLWRGYSIPASVVARDRINDLALLEADFSALGAVGEAAARSIRPLKLGNDRAPLPGETAFYYDIPAVADFSQELRLEKTRIESLSGSRSDHRMYEIDTAVRPGNSGSPLIDGSGGVIGVITSTVDNETIVLLEDELSGITGKRRTRYYSSIAVKIRYLRRLTGELRTVDGLFGNTGRRSLSEYELAEETSSAIVLVQGIVR